MKIVLLSICLVCLESTVANAQSHMPSYLQVATHFFSNYSYEKKEPYDNISFAKKKNGWFVRVIDRLKNDSVKNEQLFWNNTGYYRQLTDFSPIHSEKETEQKIEAMLQSDDPPFLYGFERCRYFGYNEWDADMIEDFSGSIPENDTLLEGLARAYAVYAERYLWHGLGGHPFDNDPLKTKLGKLELPGKKRVDKFILYINKSIDCYRILAERNPRFKMLVGSSKMKLLNEQLHQYQQLLFTGYTDEAKKALAKIEPNDSIYRQIGYTYLNACPPNSILVTFGDNDTYGPWYVQQKDSFRKDVTVLNYTLVGFPPFTNMFKKNSPTLFSTNVESLGKINFDYFIFAEQPNKSNKTFLPLKTFIKDIQTIKYPYAGMSDTRASYATKKIHLNIDIDRLKKNCNQNNLTSSFVLELKDYLLLSDFIILDILNTNLYSRPIYFTAPLSLFPAKYMQQEGSLYRLLPLKEDPKAKAKIEIAKTEYYLKKNYKPTVITYGDNQNYKEDVLLGLHAKLFSDLISNYLSLANNTKAKEWATRYIAYSKTEEIAPTFPEIRLAESLINTGYTLEAKGLIERTAQKLLDSYKNYSAIEFYYSKENLLQTLSYLNDILSTKNINSKALEKIITDISEQD